MAFLLKIGGFEMRFGGSSPERRSTLTQSDILSILGSGANGITPTDQNVLSVTPAFAAIAYISKAVAALPYSVFKRTESGSIPAESHPVFGLFAGRPHPHYTKYTFFQTLIANALMGDGYARIHYGADMRPTALELLPRQSVQADFMPDGSLYYRVSGTMNGRTVSVTLADWEMLHIKGLTFNGINGLPVRLIHADSLGMALSSQKYSKNFFDNGAHLSGFLKVTGGTLKPGQADVIRGEFKRKFGGADKAGEVPVFDMGMDYVRVGMNPKEAAVIDFRKLTAQDCSRIWQIPMHLLADLERSTFTNMEQQSADFLTHTILPLVKQVEEEFNTKLFTANEIRLRRYFTRFNLNGLMRADTESRSKFYTAGVQNGWLTPNDVRQLENLNSMDGGNDLLIQLNMQKLKDMAPLAEPDGGAAVSDGPQPKASNAN